MQDLSDISVLRPDSLRFNGLTGALAISRFDVDEWRRVLVEIKPPSWWAIDMLARQRGLGRITDVIYEMHLSPVGQPVPEVEDERNFKPAVAMMLFSPEWGLATMETCSTILVRTIGSLWDRYRSFTEASAGLLPVVAIGEPKQIQVGRATPRMFYAPTFTIVDWVERDTIAAFSATAPTVPVPLPVDQQIGFISAKRLINRPKRAAVRDTAEMIDDEIPILINRL